MRREIIRSLALLLMPAVMLCSCMFDSLSDDEIIFLSVGQGDCTHIRAGGHDVLIDGGGRDGLDTGERILMPYLLHSGAEALDMAVVTHLHMDHFKGICELSRIYPIGAVGIPADYRGEKDVMDMYDDTGSSVDVKLVYIGPDTRIDISRDVYIDTLWPAELSDDLKAADDPNEHNTVYMIHYKGLKVMVTGDLLEEDELKMIEYYSSIGRAEELDCDILKVAHHGSKSSSSEAFLDAASPSAAVIQVGAGNFYGHPHEQTLNRLEERGIKLYRTDTDGAVGIDIRRGRYLIDTFSK